MNGERLETQEQLIAANASLKTRISELEVINDFMQRRLQVEDTTTQADALRAQLEQASQAEIQLKSQLEESHRRENMLKRRLDELELELKEAKEVADAYDNGRAKKPRIIEF